MMVVFIFITIGRPALSYKISVPIPILVSHFTTNAPMHYSYYSYQENYCNVGLF